MSSEFFKFQSFFSLSPTDYIPFTSVVLMWWEKTLWQLMWPTVSAWLDTTQGNWENRWFLFYFFLIWTNWPLKSYPPPPDPSAPGNAVSSAAFPMLRWVFSWCELQTLCGTLMHCLHYRPASFRGVDAIVYDTDTCSNGYFTSAPIVSACWNWKHR